VRVVVSSVKQIVYAILFGDSAKKATHIVSFTLKILLFIPNRLQNYKKNGKLQKKIVFFFTNYLQKTILIITFAEPIIQDNSTNK
jgi:hypothetical protein